MRETETQTQRHRDTVRPRQKERQKKKDRKREERQRDRGTRDPIVTFQIIGQKSKEEDLELIPVGNLTRIRFEAYTHILAAPQNLDCWVILWGYH